MHKDELKNYLLSTGVFVDNNYLEQYLDLIINNQNKTFNEYYEKHHVLPAIYYKHAYSCNTRGESEKYVNQDKNNFLVNLLYKDHCKAH